MNRSTTTKLFSLLAAAAFLCVVIASADPPNPTNPTKKSTGDPKGPKAGGITAHLGKVHLDPEHVKIHKRTAVAHKPLDMVDKNGKKISPYTMIDLSNGKKVKAGEHFAKLNDFEKKLNELGH